MPISEKGILSLKVAALEGEVDQLLLRWPAQSNSWVLAIPLRVCRAGIILALPKDTLTEDEISQGQEADFEELIGPSSSARISLVPEQDPPAAVDVLMVEFGMKIRNQLEKKTSRTRRVFGGFAEDVTLVPHPSELAEATEEWLSAGLVRAEEFLTAREEELDGMPLARGEIDLLAEFRGLQTMLDRRLRVMEGQIHQLQEGHQSRQSQPPSVGRIGGRLGEGLGQNAGVREEEIKEAVMMAKAKVKGRRPQIPDEPGKAADTIGEAPDPLELDPAMSSGASLDDLMKLSMLKMMKDLSQKKFKNKNRKLPGLPTWEDSDSSQEEGGGAWSSTSKGGRGIEAVEKVRLAMRSHPEAYQERMEQRMLKAVDATEMTPTVPLQFVKMAPVGKSRTAGYCLQGFAEVHRLLLENKPRQARLHVLRMMSSLEQFLIDESWTVASRLTCMEEPPWGHWATQDLGAIRRQFVYNRLSEPTWVAALINQLKEEDWLKKKGQALNLKPPGKGDGKGKDNKEKDASA